MAKNITVTLKLSHDSEGKPQTIDVTFPDVASAERAFHTLAAKLERRGSFSTQQAEANADRLAKAANAKEAKKS